MKQRGLSVIKLLEKILNINKGICCLSSTWLEATSAFNALFFFAIFCLQHRIISLCIYFNLQPSESHLLTLLAPGSSNLLLLSSGKTGQFLRLIIYTSLIFLSLQCFMQIPFAYIPLHGNKKDTFHCVFGVICDKSLHSYNIINIINISETKKKLMWTHLDDCDSFC